MVRTSSLSACTERSARTSSKHLSMAKRKWLSRTFDEQRVGGHSDRADTVTVR